MTAAATRVPASQAPLLSLTLSQAPLRGEALSRSIRGTLAELGLLLRTTPLAASPYVTACPLGSPYRNRKITLSSLDDARTLAKELPAHLQAPPPWKACLAHQALTPTPEIIAWTSGYIAAQKHFFVQCGPYTPLSRSQAQSVKCPYSSAAQSSAFYAGVRGYLQQVLAQLNRSHTSQGGLV